MISRRFALALATTALVGAGIAGAVIAATGSSPKHAHRVRRIPARSASTARAPAPPPTTATARPAPPPPVSPLARLTPRQLMGQRIIYAYSGPTPPPSLLARVRAGEAAGVIFFAPNVPDVPTLHAAVRMLRDANQQSPVHAPLLLMADQEGGVVRRLPGAPVLSERQIGRSGDPVTLATEAGTGAGETLAAAGLNVNLAPVLDVFRTPGNFIDSFGRSYSSDPRLVATLGAHFISAQQHVGVAATAKHFPGLGAAAAGANTDEVPVKLDVPATVLRGDDELPYRAAVDAAVKLVVVSWAVYPALDPTRPAGLSPAVIGGELRGRVGFHGVVVTDALASGALGAFGTIPNRAAVAAAAGADLMLCSALNPDDNTPAEGSAALQGLVDALAGHQITRAAAEREAGRIIALRMSLH